MDPHNSATSDVVLVARMAQGDLGAVQRLCQQYGSAVYALAYDVLVDPASATEVVGQIRSSAPGGPPHTSMRRRARCSAGTRGSLGVSSRTRCTRAPRPGDSRHIKKDASRSREGNKKR